MTDVTDRVADATTTLLSGSAMGSDDQGCCPDLLAAGAAEGRAVLWVTY